MLYCSIASFLLSWGALSTYWDSIFGYDNFYAHGFAIGLAFIPMVIVGVPWYLILARAGVLGLAMGLWSDIWETDWIEEMGRGAFIVLSLPILLFGSV